MNALQAAAQIRNATLRARAATQMQSISTRVEAGRFQVVNATFDKKGSPAIDELSGWIDAGSAIEVLDQIAADKAFRTQ